MQSHNHNSDHNRQSCLRKGGFKLTLTLNDHLHFHLKTGTELFVCIFFYKVSAEPEQFYLGYEDQIHSYRDKVLRNVFVQIRQKKN